MTHGLLGAARGSRVALMDMIIARSPKFRMLLEEPGSWDMAITLPPFLKIALNDVKGLFQLQ